jgi:transcriptional regulator with XRE-family HTH domain
MKMLCDEPDSFEQLRFAATKGFAETLAAAMKRANLTAHELIGRTLLSKSYVYQTLDGTRIPSRDALLRFALALRLELPEVQRLLTRAGKSLLYPKVRRDAAIIACIAKRLSLCETDEFLESVEEKALL